MGSHILAAPPWQGSQGRDGGGGQLNEKKKCSGDGCCLHLLREAGGGGGSHFKRHFKQQVSLFGMGCQWAGQKEILLAPKVEAGFC